MKIAHVISSVLARFGGSTRAVLDMARWQARIGHPCTILTGAEPGYAEALDYVAVERFPVAGPYSIRYQRGFADYLKRYGASFDLFVLHSSYQYPTLAASRWCRANGKPYIFMPHGSLDPAVRSKHRLRNRAIDILYHDAVIRDAASWHFTSEEERATCERRLWRHSFVEPLGVDIAQIPTGARQNNFRDRFGIAHDATLFLFLSRLTRKKGIDILLPTFQRLVRQGLNVHLALCGPVDGNVKPLVEAALADVEAARRMTLTGLVLGDLKDAAFFDSDYFVLPTYSENFGFAAFEALAYGLPLITTTGMNLHAELAESDRVMIVPPQELAIETAMRSAAEGTWVPKTNVTETRDWLARTFSWNCQAERMVQHYQNLLTALTHERRDG